MSTTARIPPAGTARSRHLRLVTDGPSRASAPRTLGRPQGLAVALVGIGVGFALGALATLMGGGDPGTLGTLMTACFALAVPALVASRRNVRTELRSRTRTPAPLAAPAARPAEPRASLHVLHTPSPQEPLRRAA